MELYIICKCGAVCFQCLRKKRAIFLFEFADIFYVNVGNTYCDELAFGEREVFSQKTVLSFTSYKSNRVLFFVVFS